MTTENSIHPRNSGLAFTDSMFHGRTINYVLGAFFNCDCVTFIFAEGTTDTAPTESKNAHEDLRRILKERLALANSMLPTLLEELVMWNTKIQQAVDVKRKDQRLPFP